MPNLMRIDEITARLKVLLDADARLDDNLSETPTVYDQVPMPQVGLSTYTLYIEPVLSELLQPQPRTAMTFLSFAHVLRLWLIVWNDDVAVARSDWTKLLYNLIAILGDLVDDSGYWEAGLPQSIAYSGSHQNLDFAGDVRYRVGYLDFRILQELIL